MDNSESWNHRIFKSFFQAQMVHYHSSVHWIGFRHLHVHDIT